MLGIKVLGNSADLRKESENVPENPELAKYISTFKDLNVRVGNLSKYVESLQKSNQATVDAGWQTSATMHTTGQTVAERSGQDPHAPPLAKIMGDVSEYCRREADARSSQDISGVSPAVAPVQGYVADLKEAQVRKKEHNKKRKAYLAARLKGKKGDEESQTKHVYEQSIADTLAAYERLQKRNEDRLLDVFCNAYVDGYDKYIAEALQAVNIAMKDPPQHLPELSGGSARRKTSSQRAHEASQDARMVVLQQMADKELKYKSNLQMIAQASDNWEAAVAKDPKLLDRVNKQESLAIFSEAKVLLTWQTELLKMLHNWIDVYPNELVGQFILSTADRWRWYYTYIENLPRAQELTRRKMAEHAIFKKIVSDVFPLLEAPYSKIDDWLSFLKKLSNNIESTHPGAKDLKAAIKLMKSMAAGPLVEVKRRHQQQVLLFDLSGVLFGFEGSLIAAHRRLILKDIVRIILPASETNADASSLSFEDVKGRDKNEYHAFLMNDSFLYATETSKRAGKFTGDSISSTMLRFDGRLSLYGASIEDLPDSDSLYNAVQFTTVMPTPAVLGETMLSSDGGVPEAAVGGVVSPSEGWKEGVYTIVFLTLQDKRKWLPGLQQTIANANTSKCFGVPLTQLMHNNPQESTRTIPRVLDIAYDFLTAKSLLVTGIFRQSGSALTIKEYKSIMDMGDAIYIAHNENDHNIAGLLKLFIRELPEPLLTWGLYADWNRVGHAIAFERENHGILSNSLGETRRIMERLPRENKYFLQVLMKLLYTVSLPEYSNTNMMGVSNLSIVFAPILLIKKNASPFDTSDFKASNMVISTLIGEYPKIFEVCTPARCCF
eukprot:TRINITY_DN1229_c0_g1_i2.p1 TRINITY_DN1229_c0_g1~~TRINITY_DN1229_c0_g1_i2.p1  ORF type:complete len:835 (-),score=124.31 TRINITY_DN1229_c0_g1_i2:398-2902(-)